MKSLLIVLFCLFPFINIVIGQDYDPTNPKDEGLKSVKIEINEKTPTQTIQNLKTFMVDEYNTVGMKFLQMQNGKYVPIKKNDVNTLLSKAPQEQSVTLIILATVAVVLIVLLLISAIASNK